MKTYLYRFAAFIGYYLFARHSKGHGIHSPFVFRLITEVLRNKTDDVIVCNIENIRKKLLADSRIILVEDPGGGSVILKNNMRKVSDITRYSSIPRKYGMLLYNMAKEFGKKVIIELGTSFGISTMYLAAADTDAVVHTIEGSDAVADIAESNFAQAGFNNITLHRGKFEEVFPSLISKTGSPGLVFIDGDHTREHVLNYFGMISKSALQETVLIIDDINYSREMAEAWNEIKRSENVSITVDLFRTGLVFFRKGIAKCDYVIRY